MPSCLSALLGRSSSAEDSAVKPSRKSPAAAIAADASEKSAVPFDHPAHPSCAYCGDFSLPSYSSAADADATASAAAPLNHSDLIQTISSTIRDEIQGLSKDLRSLSLQMWNNPEVGFTEYKTHDMFVKYFSGKDLKGRGWEITPHAHGLETAWKAEFVNRPKGFKAVKAEDLPCVGFNSELDSLPGIGHACGHNLIAIGGIAAGLSVASALVKHSIPGRVIILGTPSEEGGGGKVLLLRDGAYKGMDACLMIHPYPTSAVGPLLAVQPFTVTFTGRTAHAGAAPFQGINAQDAAVLSYTNIGALRQQLKPTIRTHGIIVGDNWAPNVIPGKAKLIWNVRATNTADLDDVRTKTINCFKAAALATGCEVDIDAGVAYKDVWNADVLTQEYRAFMKEHFEEDVVEVPVAVSTDFGDVTYALPALHPMYRIPLSDPATQGNHTVGFAAAAKTQEAHDLTLEAAEGIAVVGARVVVDTEFREKVTKDWKEKQAKGGK